MPEYVYQAHEIKDAINKKAGGMHNLDDDDIADEVADTFRDDNKDTPAKPPPSAPKNPSVKVKKEVLDNTGPITHCAASDGISQPRQPQNTGANLLSTLSEALDPLVQAARQEECSARTFQTS
jgi:hypothetical protein